MTQARTIQIFLPSGNPQGLRVAEVTFQDIRLIVIPRSELLAAATRTDLARVGVYFLVGGIDELNKPEVYVGAAKNCFKRLLQHNKDKKKDFWNTALVAISKSEDFTILHATYLEWQSLNKAEQARRFEIINHVRPAKPHSTESLEADLYSAFSLIEILTAAVGYHIFSGLQRKEDKANVYCTTRGAQATGRYSEEGLVVYENSTVWAHESDSLDNKSREKRMLHIKNGDLKPINKDVYQLQRALVFSTPSEASNFVLARKSNGWDLWKQKNGKTLDQLKRPS